MNAGKKTWALERYMSDRRPGPSKEQGAKRAGGRKRMPDVRAHQEKRKRHPVGPGGKIRKSKFGTR